MDETRQIAITGTGGRLGGALAEWYGNRAGFTALELPREKLDLSNPEAIEEVLDGLSFDSLINAAAFTDVDACEAEAELARRVNALAPAALARAARASGARFVQVSTDYVFGGEKPGLRRETDPPRPLGVYAETKLEGERLVLEANPDALVLRTSWLFGAQRPSFIDWVISQAAENETVAAIADKISTPTSSADFVRLLDPFLPGGTAVAANGILHLCNEGACSWQQFGQEALTYLADAGFPLKTTTVASIALADLKHFVAPRPVHTAMSVDRYAGLTGTRPRAWEAALHEYLDEQYLQRT